MELSFVLKEFWKELKKAPGTAWVGLAIIVFYVFLAVFAPFLTPYGESEVVGYEFEPWGENFALGTDNLGRDMATRLIYGARNTIGIAFITTALTFMMGSVTGFMAATLGGWFDQALSRVVDILMAIPSLIFALLILTITGTSIPALIIVNVVVMDYVEVAKLRGEGLWWIMNREVLPNATAPLVAEFGLRFCFVFLFISALSFLGLGIQPPTADWGSMVRDNATLITFGDITPLLPAGAIAMLTVGVNFVVDWFLQLTSGLRDEH